MGKGSNQHNGGAEEDGNAALQGVTEVWYVCYFLGRVLQALGPFILYHTSRKQIVALLLLTDKQRTCVPEVVQAEKRSQGFDPCGISISVSRSVEPPQSNSDCNIMALPGKTTLGARSTAPRRNAGKMQGFR